MLTDFLEDEGRALELAWQVKARLIAKLPVKGAVITAPELLWILTEIEDEREGIGQTLKTEPDAETRVCRNFLRRFLKR